MLPVTGRRRRHGDPVSDRLRLVLAEDNALLQDGLARLLTANDIEVVEAVLLARSDDFQEQFVRKQEGVLRRVLVRDGKGGYADIVFFQDPDAVNRVIEAEQNSDVYATFFSIMSDDGEPLSYKTYE
jgi:hypothetical protein